ncbi:unnamed protein product [Didymodactylos carnosus]|uniref:SAM domain-containing protein n=1 Tax=Didymodactylos carnosus TaxID=1234261 RepID=A0A8S2EJK7_9BILA|nr:unnamed protein product [Didymodactylos carnosus]CAF3991674.1 unnamed protein product [Didymodactylos carnosus]
MEVSDLRGCVLWMSMVIIEALLTLLETCLRNYILLAIPIECWDAREQVGLWLDAIELGEYKSAFIRHDIRGTELKHLERRDLKVCILLLFEK